MARIPVGSFEDRINPGVSSIDTSIISRGSQYGVLANVGDKLMQMGANLEEKRYKSEAYNAVTPAMISLQKSIDEYTLQQKSQNLTGENFQKSIDTFAQQKFQEVASKMPNDLATQLFANDGQKFLAETSLNAKLYENKAKAVAQTQALDDSLQQAAQDVNPINFDSYQKTLLQGNERNNGITRTPEQVAAMRSKINTDLTNGMFEKMYNNKDYQSALNILNGGIPKITSVMDADKKNAWITKFQSKVEEDQMIKTQDIRSMAQNVSYELQNGRTPKEYGQLVAQINGPNKLSPYEKKSILDSLAVSVHVGTEVAKLGKMTNAQLANYQSPTFQGTIDTAYQRGQAQSHIQSMADKILKERQSDPAQYLTSRDPDLQNLVLRSNNFTDPQATQELITKRITEAKAFGMMPQPLTKSEASQIKSSIVGAPNGMVAATIMDKLQTSLGDYSQGAMVQAFKDKAEAPYMMMAFMPTVEDKMHVFESVKSADALKKDLGVSTVHSVDAVVQRKMFSELSALKGSNSTGAGVSLANSMARIVSLDAQKMMSVGGLSANDAVDKSYKNLIADNFVYGSGGKSEVLVPKQVGSVVNTQDALDNFLQQYTTKDTLSKIDLAVPPGYQKSFKGDRAKEAYVSALSDAGKWVLSPNHDGLILVLDTPDYGYIPAKDSSGRVVQKSFSEINSIPKVLKEAPVNSRGIPAGTMFGNN